MQKTELMKRYEAETGERATFVYTWEDSEGNEKHGNITTGGFDVWAIREAERLNEENSKLKDQLCWRPASEKPERGGWILYKRWVNENKIETFDDTGPYFVGTQDEWMSFVRRCNVVRWLPIPPAPEEKNE